MAVLKFLIGTLLLGRVFSRNGVLDFILILQEDHVALLPSVSDLDKSGYNYAQAVGGAEAKVLERPQREVHLLDTGDFFGLMQRLL